MQSKYLKSENQGKNVLSPIRVFGNWELRQKIKGGYFVVSPTGTIREFSNIEVAISYMRYSYFDDTYKAITSSASVGEDFLHPKYTSI